MSPEPLLSIGEVADRTGVAVSAVRYYDEIGVIAAEAWVGGKRRFDQGTVGRVKFVRRAKEAGFSLEEIKALLDDSRGDWRDLVDEKAAELLDRRDHLDAMIELLTEIRDCGCVAIASCPRAMPA